MSPPPTTSAGRPRFVWLPWVIFAGLAVVTLVMWQLSVREVQRTAQARFDRLTERISTLVLQRFNTAAYLLQGAAALPAASESVSPAEWSVFLRKASEQLDSGVVGLGYVERVERGAVDAFEARIRAAGFPAFTVERTGANAWLYVVVSIEPIEQNTGVLGLDIGSDNIRRTAAEEAAAADRLVLTRRIRLEYEHKQVPGFLLFKPVYRKGAELSTPPQRLAATQGWVYAPIRIDELMQGVAETTARQVDFEIFEGDTMQPETLLYDADGHMAAAATEPQMADQYARREFHTIRTLDLYGRHWTLRLSPRLEFDEANFSPLPSIVLLGGLLVSLLVAGLSWLQVNSRRRVQQRAEEMTAELRRAQDELRPLALVASRTASGVILTDTEWRVQWINEGFTRLFGYNLEEVRGRQPASFMLGPETDPKVLQAMGQAGEIGRPFVGEILNYAKDGRKVWVELEIQPISNAQGERTGFMGLQLDITERKRQAALLREAKEVAENANTAKGQFLAMMSHEIRTPMNGVIGMASLLLDTPLTPDQRESAETIRQSGDALLTIINDILDFSKIESGRLELEHTEFNLRECLEGILDLLATSAGQKQIDLLYEIADGTPPLLRGDASRLRQILVNLLGNAIKFTQRGEVFLSVKTLSWHPAGVDLHFAIHDTGIGVSAEKMERLFKPFSQVDASTTRRFGGTGLGLAISRRLVELMGGHISVESELGRGSTFSFTLRLQEVAGPAPALLVAQQNLGSRRVLVVEDNATGRRILTELARTWGMEVVPAASSLAALEQLRSEEKFDVALISMQLAELDGRVLAQRIRELPARAGLPLVLLTGLGRREKTDGLFNAVVTKPVKSSHLFNALVEIFWRRTGAAVPAPVSTPPEPVHPGRILLAEDNPVNVKVTLHQLAGLGCRADVACNGEEVLAALQRQPYDVVLLDLHMPVMDGLEAARRIRREYPGATRPWLIALTANTLPGDREQCLAAGVDDFLGKPLKVADLTAALARARQRVRG